MRTVLEKLYQTELVYNNPKPGVSEIYDEAFKHHERHENYLKETLEGKAKDAFEKLIECQLEKEQYGGEAMFVAGFRLGARIMLSALVEDDGKLYTTL